MRALSHATQNEILANLAAPADASIAQDAGVKINRDTHRRVVLRAAGRAPRESRLVNVFLPGEALEFAISGMLLASARRGVVSHQYLDQGVACAPHSLGRRVYDHAGLGRAHA
jgi:hypothetical protein